ncbi:hypothetical protein IQ07DRAFT_498217 [Pyrenochaeta sp. DS3sAY3a]|nr:hypothetical protein IQ07DRAFT_498217 [Pyrenochaeta sp. DS3sAY3a]
MSAPHGENCHPRRRPIKAQASPLSTHGMHLRKSGTFSSPKGLSTDLCDLDNHHFMPRRSPTSTESLEELLQEPSVRRVTSLLKDFDKKLAGHRAASASGASILNDPEVLPVPSFVLDNATLATTPMDIDSKPTAVQRNPHEHASDSGLGSSISGSKYGKAHSQLPVLHVTPTDMYKDNVRTLRSSVRDSINTSIISAHSAVTRSGSGLGVSEEKHTLGEYACKQIHDTIIKPILAEEALKDFHPLIKDVPRRIGEKNICNLRDLEKTLIFLAPLLHATVEHLSDQDQRLPTDRPYTNNYFLDLIEQIRRYAAIMAATREKQEKGETLDEMDYSRYDCAGAYLFSRTTDKAIYSDEKITLRGGLSHNGRPVELVREKNGKVVPLTPGLDGAYKGISKRSLSDDEMDEDEVTRSMARRRKSEKPGDVMHMCRDCKKEFKRPCDLTKHEKTHSRPWKCTEEKCKYFDLGWPTEKERDRHMNDKHSATPAQYKCLYPPCTYASKRESNCKQHMEKAHGWEYVRSKSNGRKKGPTNNDERSPTTPLTPFLGTPLSATLTTPITPFAQSPQVPMVDTFDYYSFGTPALSVQNYQDDFRRDSVTTDGSHFTLSSGHSPTEPTSFDDAVTPDEPSINHDVVFGNNCGLGAAFNTGYQQPTPAMSTGYDFSPLPFISNNGIPHLSPLAQPDVTLYSPQMQMDEGFGEMDMDMDLQAFSRPTEDFTLFDNAPPSGMPFNNTANFFPDFNQVGGQFVDNFYTEPTTTLDDLIGNNFGNAQ